MVNIQKFINSMEVLFSVEYITPPLIIYGVFNWLFTLLWLTSVYYFIGDHILQLYPTSTFWCVCFELYAPFSLASFQTDVLHHWKGFVSFHICPTYPPFLFSLFLCLFSLPVLTTSAYQRLYALAKNYTISLSFLPITSLFGPSQKSDLLASRTPNTTMLGFGAYFYTSFPNLPWTTQSPI